MHMYHARPVTRDECGIGSDKESQYQPAQRCGRELGTPLAIAESFKTEDGVGKRQPNRAAQADSGSQTSHMT